MADLNSMSVEELRAYAAKLQAANDAAHAPKPLTLKVSAKGAISIYGLGRWPVTLYRTQAERIFNPEFCGKVKAFIDAKSSELTTKPTGDATGETENVAK